jgi:hypothetical protein
MQLLSARRTEVRHPRQSPRFRRHYSHFRHGRYAVSWHSEGFRIGSTLHFRPRAEKLIVKNGKGFALKA